LPKVRYGAADDHFAATYGLRMLRGRFFDARDLAGAERVAVVDPVFAERYADGGDVVGRQFRLDPRSTDGPRVTVVGVIAPLKLDAPGDEVQPVMLAPLRQDPARFVSLVVQTRGNPNAFVPRLNAIMREVDADTPLCQANGTTALLPIVDFLDVPNPTGFTVYLLNPQTGQKVTGTGSWTARGY
jgi:hypothetical protein